MALTGKRALFVEEYPKDLNATKAAERATYSPRTAYSQGQRLLKDVEVKAAIDEALKARSIRARVDADQVLERWDRRARSTAEDFLTFRTVQEPTHHWVSIPEAIEYYQKEVEIERQIGQRLGLEGDAEKAHDAEVDKLEQQVVRLEVLLERDPGRMVKIPGPLVTRVEPDFDLARMKEAGRLDLVKSVQRDKDGGLKVQLHDAAQADEAIAKHLGMFTEKIDVTSGGKTITDVAITVRSGDGGA